MSLPPDHHVMAALRADGPRQLSAAFVAGEPEHDTHLSDVFDVLTDLRAELAATREAAEHLDELTAQLAGELRPLVAAALEVAAAVTETLGSVRQTAASGPGGLMALLTTLGPALAARRPTAADNG